MRLADVLRDLSIARSTYHDQAGVLSRPDPKGALRVRVRASFEASGGAYGSQSVWADLRRGGGEPVSWRDLEPGDLETPVVVSEKVVRAIMAEEGLVAAKARQMRRRARYSSYAGERGERPPNLPLREDDSHDFSSPEPGLLVVTDVTEFALDGYRAYLSPAIDCFDGRPVCWTVSEHPDRGPVLGMLRGARRGSAADRGAPAHRAHRRRGRLHERRLGGGVRGVPRGPLDVALCFVKQIFRKSSSNSFGSQHESFSDFTKGCGTYPSLLLPSMRESLTLLLSPPNSTSLPWCTCPRLSPACPALSQGGSCPFPSARGTRSPASAPATRARAGRPSRSPPGT